MADLFRTDWFSKNLRVFLAKLCLEQAHNRWDNRDGNDTYDQQLKMLLYKRNAAKEESQQREERGPGNTAQHVEEDEGVPLHAAYAGEKRHERADEREKTTQEDGQMAPLVEERLGLFDTLGRHDLDLARSDDLLAKEVADHEIALIAQNRCAPCHREQREDIEAAIGGKAAACKQQRIAGQKGHENHAGLDEDNQEDKAICRERARCDPGRNRRTRVFKQLDDRIDEIHGVKPLCFGRGIRPSKKYTCGGTAQQKPNAISSNYA